MRKILPFALFALLVFSSCATYFVSTHELEKSIKSVSIDYGAKYINAIDKNGDSILLLSSKSTGIRITEKDNTRQTFYFMTAYIQDSLIKGSKSTFFSIPIKPIKISEIKKIEVDGR